MATRRKKGLPDSEKTATPKKRVSTKTAKARVVEELQNVGADVIPSVTIEVTPPAVREHRVEQIQPTKNREQETLLSDWDLYLFNEGSHHKLWEKLGSHIVERDGVLGTNFAVWAPNAEQVSVIGEFNGWDPRANGLEARANSGIWEGFIPRVGKGSTYKYHIVSRHNGYRVDKADPLGIHHETPPRTASIVWDLDYEWNDDEWMSTRKERNSFTAPMTMYELHIGSWRRIFDEHGVRPMSYRELAEPLAEYAKKMNFTHIEFMPVMEHPFYGSWGYQVTGYFAPTSRFGTPQDFKYLVDVLHQNGIGVILDWVPSHFPSDEHGLAYFDGTHLFEHADPRKGFHPDWSSLIFNYGRNEVRSFLLSSAFYWLGEYHADGLRVDAVASMLYLDYSRKHGEWIPNEFGGRENIEAISFLRRVNEDVYKVLPDVQVIAEESTAWPMVSRPTYVGGLGFGMKWDMGWMHDTLRYFSKDPIHRRFHHNDLTFRMMYAFTENFVLPLSHDEVVHGKGSLIGKMPGDDWQKFANLRLLFAHMYSQPGKKLLFMGGEIGQWREWNHEIGLDWHLLDYVPHATLQRWVEDLNRTYRDLPALHELDMSPEGFEWIDCCDTENSIVSVVRKSRSRPDELVVIVLNFTPLPRYNYQIGVPRGGRWKEILNSDAPVYGGSGQGNMGAVDAAPIPLHGRRWSVNLTLPPLGAVFLTPETELAG
ncbi:MAG TPA: 1,4-alpha-glucan branching protein GlgB [Thermoanaerobaculia bacterium]|jgi:1,4-alpha-glucan branching enzyme|nr:1,4-alpha-glucan branching protein GlgB [Thermoanaerobaculia bacterium]